VSGSYRQKPEKKSMALAAEKPECRGFESLQAHSRFLFFLSPFRTSPA
jgi:hypothetical protein